MSTSPYSSSETEALRSPTPQGQPPRPVTRRRQRRFTFKKLAIFAIFIILIQGYANLAAPPALVALAEEGEERTGEVTRHNASDSLRSLAAEPLPIQDAPTPTPSPLPTATEVVEPTPTLPPPAGDGSNSTSIPASQPSAIIAPLASETSLPGIRHVVIISIDGLRPDALDQAITPNLDDLRTRGTYSPVAQTVRCSETLPSHASMVSGMVPEKHGIIWGIPYIGWPGMNGPTLFSAAHDAGLSTGMVFGKEKLNYLILPNSVDKVFGQDAGDPEIKEWAVEFIESGLPNVLFIHFPDTDRVGHAFGWMAENQLYSITFVDGLIGEIVAALETGGYMGSTLLIITSDHGGHGKRHGDDSPIDRTIPWLAVGPGVPANVVLHRNINIYDVAATALHALGVPVPEIWDGQPVMEIFQREPVVLCTTEC